MNNNGDYSSEEEEDEDYDPTREPRGEGEEDQGAKNSKPKREKRGAAAGSSGKKAAELAKAELAPAGGLGRGRAMTAPVDPLAELKAEGRKSKINDIWEQLKAKEAGKQRPAGTSSTPLFQSTLVEPKKAPGGGASRQQQPAWMAGLATGPLGKAAASSAVPPGGAAAASSAMPGGSTLSIAAAALAAAKATADAPVIDRDGKIEVKETLSFAGDQVVVTKLVDAESKAAAAAKRKAEAQGSSKGLDALLAQIEKKKKLNILDKSRMDWGEFKEESGIVNELEEHKKSGDKYTEKVAFLQRTELREYEVERDQRLATQSRKPHLPPSSLD